MTRVLQLLPLLALAGASCLDTDRSDAPRLAPWGRFGFRALRTPRARSLHFTLTTPPLAGADAEVRLLFEVQPGNTDYYFVSVRSDRLQLGKVECGVELSLAEWRGAAASGPPPFGQAQTVTVKRSPGRILVAVGSSRAIEKSDDTFTQGRAAIGACELPEASRPEVRVRSVGEIYATDNFMRTKEEQAAWRVQSGDWGVDWRDNPNLSANAFTYTGRPAAGKPAAVVLGEDWWDDYTFEVSAQPAGAGGFGLFFRYLGPKDHYLFRYAGGELQLVRVRAGQETILARESGTLTAGQWYRMAVVANGALLEGVVDGNRAVQARDDGLAFGAIGLCVTDPKGTKFDDVFVHGEGAVNEDFGDGHIAWIPKGGRWWVDTSGGAARLRAVGPSEADPLPAGKLLGGEDVWAGYRVSATVAAGSTGPVGVVARYRDESEHVAFLLDTKAARYRLVLVRDGEAKVVSEAPAPSLTESRELSLSLRRGVLVGEADGKRVVSHFDDHIASGKAGLCVGRGATAAFERLSVSFPGETEPVLTQLDTFARETTMAAWAAEASDWRELSTRVAGKVRRIRWHRGAFPGGGELRVRAFFDSTRPGTLRLYSCCELSSGPRGRVVESGYELSLAAGGVLRLAKNGQVVASREGLSLRGGCPITLRAGEGYVLGELDGAVVLSFADNAPPTGWNTGYAAENVFVKPEDVDVLCDRTRSYSFVRAAADWRTAGGEWYVMNRWRCDPRWSFFGGESMNGAAVIWNKVRFEGDLTLEVAAGIRHQRGRGAKYAHASDMNIVIGGDGRSLTSGYGFFFGGWRNSRSAITRNGEVVATSRRVIPSRTTNIHRRWFYLKVVKHGARFRLYIDNALVLEYTDPDPLPDGQVALWTWKNGLIVGRVRIAADRIGRRESFLATYPDVSPTVYDR